MSSRADSKTASQFASLTLRLKDKLHPPRIRSSERIKHTQSQRVKPPDLHLQQHKSGGVLVDQQRAVLSSLQYFKALVDRLGVDRPGRDKLVLDQLVVGGLLGGASTGVLEAVQTLVQLEPHLHNRTISTCLTRLYHSLAELIRWADQVMLQGVSHDNKESTESVTSMIRAVLDDVKELVRLAAERQDVSAPLSPVQSQSENQEISERTVGEEETVLAPPKPPMPLPEPLPLGQSPPALPPKKRHSSSGPASCRVAIVAPWRREPDEDRQVQQECEDDCWKRPPAAAQNTHCEDDPDYDFLLTDQSSSETLPPLAPALPEKRRRSTAGMTLSHALPTFGFDSALPGQNPAHCNDVTDDNETGSSPLSPSKTPPPLPEKKRHIHQYLQFCSSYTDQSAVSFYQRHKGRQREQVSHSHLDTDSTPSPEQLPAPALPLKKKQQDSGDRQPEESQSRDSPQQDPRVWRSSEEEVDEVLLTNQQEILHRITMKAEVMPKPQNPDPGLLTPDS
ncbi:rap guanine nucleotide exchange factor 1 isoform X2 [Stegastes partitus]|uniref:Rap guanine nucleotide exchange factor 1 isoform X2 n=1 Tax=Stegastes partitus TaxID=144197 RepID=A0A9Y4NUX5_9TELE|nr:PREDICTED: rap guanine nucleotide exchange factor 1 isoform X2 [Stegastes partitus]